MNHNVNGPLINIISNELCNSSAKLSTINSTNQNRVFYVTNGHLKPIHLPNIKSGVFRSTKMSVLAQQHTDKIDLDYNILPSVGQEEENISLNCLNTNHFEQNNCEQMSVVSADCSKIDKSAICNNRANQEIINFVNIEKDASLAVQTFRDINLSMNGDYKTFHYENSKSKMNIFYEIINPDYVNIVSSLDLTKASQQKNSMKNKRIQLPIIRKDKNEICNESTVNVTTAITRSGRLSRPPLALVKSCYSKTIENKQKCEYQKKNHSSVLHSIPPSNNVPSTLFTNKPVSPVKIKKKIPSNYICKTCSKIYLGENKVKKHLKAHPDHEMMENQTDATHKQDGIFEYLLTKIQHIPKDEKPHKFLNEISDFIGKLDIIRSRLICSSKTSIIEYFDQNTSKAFGIEKGNYQINPNALSDINVNDLSTYPQHSQIPDDDYPSIGETNSLSAGQNLEYNLNLSLDSISGSKINLTEGISEESLLQSVEDLVKEQIKHLPENALTSTTPVTFHHINDNAVEAVGIKDHVVAAPVLDLSIDLFQFHSN